MDSERAARTIWRATEHRQLQWRNGGGATREIASSPPTSGPDDFDWRISVAEVAADGPFSPYPGVDRVIVLLTGPAMVLTVDGVRHELRRHEPFRFPGAATTGCEIPGGPTRDLNIMTRQGTTRASVEVLHVSEACSVTATGRDVLVLLTLAGSASAGTPDGGHATLGELDALCWAGAAGTVQLRGVATVAVVRLTPER